MISESKPIPQSIEELSLLVPIIAQEVWASGVTYERTDRN